jgi:hypothetical protein
MSTQPLDIFFRGKRPYIQGSLILSAAAALLCQAGSKDTGHDLTLIKAKFSNITDKGLILSDEASAPHADAALIGDASFRGGDGVKTVYFFEDKTVVPARRDDRGSLLTNLTITEPLNGTASYDILPSIDELLGAIVEAVKALHQALGKTVYDVWFTGFSGAKLPTTAVDISTTGTLTIKNMMRRGTEEQYQTLFRIELNQDNQDAPQSFMLTFAYKTA